MKEMLNEGQKLGFDKFKNWYENDKQDKDFVVSGYAGTGKTFFISSLINYLKSKNVGYKVVAPTGKAATILKRKGIEATTIHKLICDPVEDELTGKIIWELKPRNEFNNFSIIFADESTMISKKIHQKLLLLDKRIIYSGDIGQLPPIEEKNNIFDNIDVMLTENMRQVGEDNRITEIASIVRNGGQLEVGVYGNVYVKRLSTFNHEQLMALYDRADQVLCGRNDTRHKINQQLKIDKSHNQISEGDKIICLNNSDDIFVDENKEVSLCNGLVGICSLLGEDISGFGVKCRRLNFRSEYFPDESARNIPFSLKENDNEMYHKIFEKFYKDSSGRYHLWYKGARVNPKECIKINQFDLAYAISVHKAQGSEWDNVVVIDESNCFRDDKYKWLYTAITRAKKKLVILI